ncbi:hypothetical protein V8D89_002181 [Ganoderma adspersum]
MNATSVVAAHSTPVEPRPTATAPLATLLPPELILRILDGGEWLDWRRLLALTHICHHWRKVLLNEWRFWTDASSQLLLLNYNIEGKRKERLEVILSRLQGRYPLRLTVSDDDCRVFVSRLEEVSAIIYGPVVKAPSPDRQWAPRLTELTLKMGKIGNLRSTLGMLGVISAHVMNLEILRIPDKVNDFDPSADPPSVSWPDSSFPLLHTLSISGRLFFWGTVVGSLKTIDLHDDRWDPNVIVEALKKCASSLESLTLRAWSEWPVFVKADPNVDEDDGTGEGGEDRDIVDLPRLRYLKMKFPAAPSLILERLSYPSDVTVHINWSPVQDRYKGSNLPFLPALVGLHPPGPFFDSLCLSFFSEPSCTSTLHCSIGGVDHLRMEGWHNWSKSLPTGRMGGSGFLDEGRSAAVTEFAIDVVDTYKNSVAPSLEFNAGTVRTFVRRFTNLRHLTVLASLDGNIQVEATAGFLDLLTGPWLSDSASNLGDRCLTYVCVLPVIQRQYFRNPEERNLDWIEVFRSEIVPEFDNELKRLNRLLEDRLAEHHQLLLSRLELCCVRVPLCVDHSNHPSLPRAPYRNASDIPLSFVYPVMMWEDKYLESFQKFAHEVVFIGPGDRI